MYSLWLFVVDVAMNTLLIKVEICALEYDFEVFIKNKPLSCGRQR